MMKTAGSAGCPSMAAAQTRPHHPSLAKAIRELPASRGRSRSSTCPQRRAASRTALTLGTPAVTLYPAGGHSDSDKWYEMGAGGGSSGDQGETELNGLGGGGYLQGASADSGIDTSSYGASHHSHPHSHHGTTTQQAEKGCAFETAPGEQMKGKGSSSPT